MYKLIREYCCGIYKKCVKSERKFLMDKRVCRHTGVNVSKNSGKISEWYVGEVLRRCGIKYIKHPKIKYGMNGRYLQPDFYIPSKDMFIEVKSRTYNCGGTSSEKIDHVSRKYSTKLRMTNKYKNSKVLVVFCAGELHERSTMDLINYRKKSSGGYVKDFVNFSKRYNILDWISVNDLEKYIK